MIILLNGTSSAGKTMLALELQQRFDGVLLRYGVDTMVQAAFPDKCDAPPWNEQAILVEMQTLGGEPHARLKVSPYMIPVYRQAVAFYRALSQAGYDLIVDEVLFDARRVAPYFELLADQTVYFVGVQPDKAVVVQRERERGDRLPGLAAGLYEEVYDPRFRYDLRLDTGRLSAAQAADEVLALLARVKTPTGFRESAQRWRVGDEAAC